MVDMIEGHPIPQDITGFQFRLIGDMTVKQFAYLAVSLVIGWICFIFPVPFLIKVIMAFFPVMGGVTLAFIPIQGVPADTILMLFFRALVKPNQYVYNKVGKDFTAETVPPAGIAKTVPVAEVKKNSGENTTPTPVTPPIASATLLPKKEEKTMPPVAQVLFKQTAASVPVTPVPPPAPILAPAAPPPVFSAPTPPLPPPAPTQVIVEKKEENPLAKQLEELASQKKQLEEQLQQLMQQQTAPVSPPAPIAPAAPPPAPPPVADPDTYMKKVPTEAKKAPQAPFMPDVPNLVAGIIKDARGNVLPNILIEVKDRDENPVRAFKTNALGQFASATPLLNGTYTITFEDPKKQQRFDTIELSVTGEILPPLEITSIDEREELRKSLFTN